jgi:hypothetical protein
VTPLIPYAKLETRAGVSVIEEPSFTCVIAPPLRGWRIFAHPRWWGGAFCLYSLVIGVFAIVQHREFGALFGVVFWTVIGTLCLRGQIAQIGRRRIFEVTPSEVRVGYVVRNRISWIEHWRRSAIGEIRTNFVTGDLLIRVTGQDLKDYFISRDRLAVERIAAALNAALLKFSSPPPMPAFAKNTVGIPRRDVTALENAGITAETQRTQRELEKRVGMTAGTAPFPN